MDSLHEFYTAAIARSRTSGERYGQAVFNLLHEVRPQLSEQVRGTGMDPYHVLDTKDASWRKFVAFLESHWYSHYHYDPAIGAERSACALECKILAEDCEAKGLTGEAIALGLASAIITQRKNPAGQP